MPGSLLSRVDVVPALIDRGRGLPKPVALAQFSRRVVMSPAQRTPPARPFPSAEFTMISSLSTAAPLGQRADVADIPSIGSTTRPRSGRRDFALMFLSSSATMRSPSADHVVEFVKTVERSLTAAAAACTSATVDAGARIAIAAMQESEDRRSVRAP